MKFSIDIGSKYNLLIHIHPTGLCTAMTTKIIRHSPASLILPEILTKEWEIGTRTSDQRSNRPGAATEQIVLFSIDWRTTAGKTF
jgi:hypothetical protein